MMRRGAIRCHAMFCDVLGRDGTTQGHIVGDEVVGGPAQAIHQGVQVVDVIARHEI